MPVKINILSQFPRAKVLAVAEPITDDLQIVPVPDPVVDPDPVTAGVSAALAMIEETHVLAEGSTALAEGAKALAPGEEDMIVGRRLTC